MLIESIARMLTSYAQNRFVEAGDRRRALADAGVEIRVKVPPFEMRKLLEGEGAGQVGAGAVASPPLRKEEAPAGAQSGEGLVIRSAVAVNDRAGIDRTTSGESSDRVQLSA